MKFKDAVRHLEDLGLTVVMPDDKAYRTRKLRRYRNPVRAVPVIEQDTLPAELREAIRRSRAEIQNSSTNSHGSNRKRRRRGAD